MRQLIKDYSLIPFKIASAHVPFLPAHPDSGTNFSSVVGDPKLRILAIPGQFTANPEAVVAIESRNLVSCIMRIISQFWRMLVYMFIWKVSSHLDHVQLI